MVGLGPRKRRSIPENGFDMIPAASPALQPAACTRPTSDWKRMWRDAVRDPRELLGLLGLDALSGRLSDAAMAQFPLRVPRGFVARMRHGDPHDPLLRQVLPLDDEEQIVPGFALDAVGDAAARCWWPPAAVRCIAATASAGTSPTARKPRPRVAGPRPSP